MNNKHNHKLSGAEALEEYFTSLLDEELDFEHQDSDFEHQKIDISTENAAQNSALSAEIPQSSDEESVIFQPQPQLDDQSIQTELDYNEFDVPDLNDVQKLLDKLESTDVVEEADIASLIEKNTADIAQIDTKITTIAEDKAEEIQQWQVETQPSVQESLQPEVFVEQAAEKNDVPELAKASELAKGPESTNVPEQETTLTTETEVQFQSKGKVSPFDDWKSTEREHDFQVLYFEVNGITFAVPLDELGGIHKTAEMSHLIGRPAWYLGLQTNKDNQYDVVDTAKWVMSDRLTDDAHKDAYQYIVMLGNSSWGLAATELKGTELLNVESVRWRTQAAKRPWLAGMVKEKMCALIHVEAMIKMITAGMDVKSLDSDKGLSKAT
ncbi:chemotaxis protein CheW [Vibrio sp. MA40-2]|uniref:chemotaxis protein CheW n=1 Tax=Vibrio sp. MA40-2 TaxID=3391828 RepID=UPI0039A6A3C1